MIDLSTVLPGDPRVVYRDDDVMLICSKWQDVIGDLPVVDAVITDPPYSERTHAGSCLRLLPRRRSHPRSLRWWSHHSRSRQAAGTAVHRHRDGPRHLCEGSQAPGPNQAATPVAPLRQAAHGRATGVRSGRGRA